MYLEYIDKKDYNSNWYIVIKCYQLIGGIKMAISYNKMWKLLVDKKMSKADLRKAANIAPNTMTKLRRDEPVNLAILCRACEVLGCDFGDIMEYVSEENQLSRRSNYGYNKHYNRSAKAEKGHYSAGKGYPRYMEQTSEV